MSTSDFDRWTAADIPDLEGRRAVVTGASSGLGLETAAELAGHGAEVTLAVRDGGRGDDAAAQIRARFPGARVSVGLLDLSALASVRAFADRWLDEHPDGLDLLVNNAGVMAIPRRESADGFELQLATNHLGHVALTASLLPALVHRPGSRVVTVSSSAHRAGRIRFDDLMGLTSYRPWTAYGQSKLANLLFALELQRRLDAAGLPVISVAAHPGYAATNLQAVGPRMAGSRLREAAMGVANRVLAQSAAQGALPSLYAATEPGLPGGTYVGPGGLMETRGHPRVVQPSDAARDEDVARRLWDVSVELTGADFGPLA